VLLAATVADWRTVGLSLIGAVVVNLVLALNHRPGRYLGV
ncbi:MAG: YitT family protein, partial [Cellulomonadaceae bacterium]|nr:YitT family protein [Cellulomonadaceae bacterium]